MSARPVSRGATASIDKQRSASDLNAALARRRAWVGDTPAATDPSAIGSVEVAPSEGALGDPESQNPEPNELTPIERRKQALLRDALASRGVRYRYGGSSRGGFDCSGFTRWLMARNLGIKLPHSASAQARYGQKVAPGELKEGDLVFFRTTRRGISHVGMYVGNNRFIHAPRTGRSVAVDSLAGYYKRRYVTARRLTRDSGASGLMARSNTKRPAPDRSAAAAELAAGAVNGSAAQNAGPPVPTSGTEGDLDRVLEQRSAALRNSRG